MAIKYGYCGEYSGTTTYDNYSLVEYKKGLYKRANQTITTVTTIVNPSGGSGIWPETCGEAEGYQIKGISYSQRNNWSFAWKPYNTGGTVNATCGEPVDPNKMLGWVETGSVQNLGKSVSQDTAVYFVNKAKGLATNAGKFRNMGGVISSTKSVSSVVKLVRSPASSRMWTPRDAAPSGTWTTISVMEQPVLNGWYSSSITVRCMHDDVETAKTNEKVFMGLQVSVSFGSFDIDSPMTIQETWVQPVDNV